VSVRTIALPTYEVTVAPGALDRIGEIAGTSNAHRYAVLTDDNVGPLYAARVRDAIGAPDRTTVLTVPAGEAHKTRDTWARLTDELLAAGFGRDSLIVALGGGVVGDVAGFVAATYMRGIPYIQVPTTLLAMVDASIGGKTGVDTPAGKNLVGAFHQPLAVVVDPNVLATLPRAHLRAGFAEVIKHGAIADEAYLERAVAAASDLGALEPGSGAMIDLVSRSIEIKADVVRRDEREGGVRKILNFGHTIGHAVELLSDYSMLHGDASPWACRTRAKSPNGAVSPRPGPRGGSKAPSRRRDSTDDDRHRCRPSESSPRPTAIRKRAAAGWSTRCRRVSGPWPARRTGGRLPSTTSSSNRCWGDVRARRLLE